MHHLTTMAPQEVNGQSRVLHKRLVQDFLLDFQRRRNPSPCWIDCRMSAQGPLRRIRLFLVTQGNENEGLSSSPFPISYVCKGCYVIKLSVVKELRVIALASVYFSRLKVPSWQRLTAPLGIARTSLRFILSKFSQVLTTVSPPAKLKGGLGCSCDVPLIII